MSIIWINKFSSQSWTDPSPTPESGIPLKSAPDCTHCPCLCFWPLSGPLPCTYRHASPRSRTRSSWSFCRFCNLSLSSVPHHLRDKSVSKFFQPPNAYRTHWPGKNTYRQKSWTPSEPFRPTFEWVTCCLDMAASNVRTRQLSFGIRCPSTSFSSPPESLS